MRYNSKGIISDSGGRRLDSAHCLLKRLKELTASPFALAVGSNLGTGQTDAVDCERFPA